ncbi:hypothetical protein KPL74_03655 [Bacillus sp. NP157]|nr:hypothetical protein KPL74_03655 [Bacillus sp. NP157]
MGLSFATAMRRAASTCLVLLALFVACVPASAMTQASHHAGDEMHAVHVMAAADELAAADEIDPSPSIEDNTVNLDDTFDVPREHVVPLARVAAPTPASLDPAPHAHHHSFELRPPIAL